MLVITKRKQKQGLTLFAAASDARACSIPLIDDVKFISRPPQKFLSDISGLLQLLYNLRLSAASVVAFKMNIIEACFCAILKQQ